MDVLKIEKGFWYIGTPYSKYSAGLDAAYRDACAISAQLLMQRVPLFSPIAHTHGIAINGELDLFDYEIWLPFDQAMIDAAHGMVVVEMEGWVKSYGMLHEIAEFKRQGKPIFHLDPKTLDVFPHEARLKHLGERAASAEAKRKFLRLAA